MLSLRKAERNCTEISQQTLYKNLCSLCYPYKELILTIAAGWSEYDVDALFKELYGHSSCKLFIALVEQVDEPEIWLDLCDFGMCF